MSLKKNTETIGIKTLGNVAGGKTQSRTVYSSDGISPTLMAGMDHGNTIPYVI